MHVTRRILLAAAAALTAAPLSRVASAQTPGLDLNPDGSRRPLTPEEQAKRKAIEDAYRATMKKVPDQKAPSDPWGEMRAPTTSKRSQH